MSPDDYLNVARKDPMTAMVPFGIVQEILDLSRSAVVDRIKVGHLQGVKVETEDAIYRGVTLASLFVYIDKQPKRASDKEIIVKIERQIIEKIKSTKSDRVEDITLTYSEVMQPLGMSWRNPRDRKTIGELLGWGMSEKSCKDKKRGFMISAVVVRKATGRPNPAFFDYARKLELLADDEDDEVFWQKQIKAIRNFYR